MFPEIKDGYHFEFSQYLYNYHVYNMVSISFITFLFMKYSNDDPNTSFAPEPVQDDKKKINVLMYLPTKDKTQFYPINEDQYSKLKKTFPAVNVLEQLRRMETWLTNKQGNLKTYKGMGNFISRWLGKHQTRQGEQQPNKCDRAPEQNINYQFRKFENLEEFNKFESDCEERRKATQLIIDEVRKKTRDEINKSREKDIQ